MVRQLVGHCLGAFLIRQFQTLGGLLMKPSAAEMAEAIIGDFPDLVVAKGEGVPTWLNQQATPQQRF